jgi:hypothetical protein
VDEWVLIVATRGLTRDRVDQGEDDGGVAGWAAEGDEAEVIAGEEYGGIGEAAVEEPLPMVPTPGEVTAGLAADAGDDGRARVPAVGDESML